MAELVQVAQRAEDLDRARDWYAWLLEAEPAGVFDPPGLVFFRLGEVRLLLDRNAPSALLYLRVPDVHAAVARCRTRGIDVLSEPHLIFSHDDDALGPAGSEEWMAFVADSEGNDVGLVSHHPPPSPAGSAAPQR